MVGKSIQAVNNFHLLSRKLFVLRADDSVCDSFKRRLSKPTSGLRYARTLHARCSVYMCVCVFVLLQYLQTMLLFCCEKEILTLFTRLSFKLERNKCIPNRTKHNTQREIPNSRKPYKLTFLLTRTIKKPHLFSG